MYAVTGTADVLKIDLHDTLRRRAAVANQPSQMNKPVDMMKIYFRNGKQSIRYSRKAYSECHSIIDRLPCSKADP